MPETPTPMDDKILPIPDRTPNPRRRRPLPRSSRGGETAEEGWVDVVADDVATLLSEEGLDLELIVFYDPLTETLHAVGYDGAPARYFRSLEGPMSKDPRPGAAELVPPARGRAPKEGGSEESGPCRTSRGEGAILPMTAMAGTPPAMRPKGTWS